VISFININGSAGVVMLNGDPPGVITKACFIRLFLSRHMCPAYSNLFETRLFWIFVPLKILSISALVIYSYFSVSVLYMGLYIFL